MNNSYYKRMKNFYPNNELDGTQWLVYSQWSLTLLKLSVLFKNPKQKGSQTSVNT